MVGLTLAPPLVGWLLQRIGDYRHVFLFCGVLASLALVALIALFAQWKKLGGDLHFTPPDPAGKKTPIRSAHTGIAWTAVSGCTVGRSTQLPSISV
jgi:MFS family permease